MRLFVPESGFVFAGGLSSRMIQTHTGMRIETKVGSIAKVPPLRAGLR
jgi:hypothetical protein